MVGRKRSWGVKSRLQSDDVHTSILQQVVIYFYFCGSFDKDVLYPRGCKLYQHIAGIMLVTMATR